MFPLIPLLALGAAIAVYKSRKPAEPQTFLLKPGKVYTIAIACDQCGATEEIARKALELAGITVLRWKVNGSSVRGVLHYRPPTEQAVTVPGSPVPGLPDFRITDISER